ncbi:unnamed protein product, partial [Closterium sp. Naga37s-1]
YVHPSLLSAEEQRQEELWGAKAVTILAHVPPFPSPPPPYVHPSLLSVEERRQEELRGVKERFGVHEGDTGSSEVQIALLTSRIAYMAQHLQTHKKLLSPCLQDLHSRRGLDGMLARRRKLLKYLRRKNWDSYCHVIAELGLRDRVDLQS